MAFDIADFSEEETKKIETLEAGKLYELSVMRKGVDSDVKVSKVYFVKSCNPDGTYKVIMTNPVSTWSDSAGVLYKTSSRLKMPELDMLSIDSKNIRELSVKESKSYVDSNIKSWSIRDKFGLKPIKRITHLGYTEEVKYT